MLGMVSYRGDYAEVERWVRNFMDRHADRVIEVRYEVMNGHPNTLAEIVYRVGGRNAYR